jgi:hypothetical protein
MNIDIKELLDDDAFDPEKLFNEEEYSTLIINREGFDKKQNSTADLLEALLDKEISRPESEAIFLKLKEMNAQALLVNAISSAQRTNEKAILTAACWESGLDFTNDILFFVELACSEDFRLAMEALTVVEQCEGPVESQVISRAMSIAGKATGNAELITDLKEIIRSKAA